MKTLITFFKKELLEQFRSKKLLIITVMFLVFGIANIVIVKLTPMLLEMFSESLQDVGIKIEGASVTALDSWMQFYKNISLLLIAFILIQSGIFAKEYQNRSLIIVLSKGFERYKIVISKLCLLVLMWTIGYLLYFGVTYLGNEILWDNSVASNIGFSAILWWLFGVFTICIFTLMASYFQNNGLALVSTGFVVVILYLINIIPNVIKYLPIALTNGMSLIYGLTAKSYYIPSIIITGIISIVLVIITVLSFNKKKI